MKTGLNFVCSRLRVATRIKESASCGGPEPRDVVTSVPIDELVAVRGVEAGIEVITPDSSLITLISARS